jgi:NADPH:quinone reductase-like Zn-dependent oxidoreductase
MRAVGVIEFGGPEVLRIVDLPESHAGPGEMRIRVRAATVNPTDTFVRDGSRADRMRDVDPPYVPGMDVAGMLDEIGPDVDTDLAVGDRVMAIVVPNGSHGGYSESLVVPAGSVAMAPVGASHVEAATLPMNGLTARLTLDELGLEPGQVLAVTGAAGAYGGYVVQLAKADGLEVIADASEADEKLVSTLGADVIVGRGDDVADRIRAAYPDGVDAVADGALLKEKVLPAVRDGGGFVSLRGWEGPSDRSVTFHPILVRRYAEEQAKLDQLGRQVEAGLVTLRVARAFPASEASEAHRLLELGGSRGRFVIEF